MAAGAWLFSARLHEPDTATVVRVSGGGVLTTDGPFAETKDHLGGFHLIEAADLDAALGWAAKVTACIDAPIEVRPLAAFADEPQVCRHDRRDGGRGPDRPDLPHGVRPVGGRLQVALTLRLLGGLSTAEVASAFLVTEPAMAGRLVRAKRKTKAARIPCRVPEAQELPGRLRSVLAVIYLVYNAGPTSPNLCAEAIRLARLLANLVPDEPEVTGSSQNGQPRTADRVSRDPGTDHDRGGRDHRLRPDGRASAPAARPPQPSRATVQTRLLLPKPGRYRWAQPTMPAVVVWASMAAPRPAITLTVTFMAA